MTKKKNRYNEIPSMDKAGLIAGWLTDTKATDVQTMDVSGLSDITEAMVVATANSSRHAKGLADTVLDNAAKENLEFLGMEGKGQGGWILLDLNDVIVHIFTAEKRALYDLEGLWTGARPSEPAESPQSENPEEAETPDE